MERYTTTSGEVITYAKPAADVAAFLARVIAATNDPHVSEAELTELVYSKQNPILDHTVFAGRGAVTSDVFANPLYRVFTDLLEQKAVLEGTFVPERDEAAYTLTVADAAEQIGITADAVRKAIRTGKLAARQIDGAYRIDPRAADLYREEVRPRGTARSADSEVPSSAEQAAAALRVRCGSEPGRSLRIKGAPVRNVSKHAAIVDLIVPSFDDAIVATTSTKTLHVFQLKSSEKKSRIEWGPFFVEGNFCVSREITDTREAANAWESFGSILPTPMLEKIDRWTASYAGIAPNERHAWEAFEEENRDYLKTFARAIRSRARLEFLERLRQRDLASRPI